MKKQYIKPTTTVTKVTMDKLMIPISGTTTPGDSDAKEGGDMWDEDDEQPIPHYNVWED